MLQLFVDCLDIESKLPCICRLEFAGFELHDNISS